MCHICHFFSDRCCPTCFCAQLPSIGLYRSTLPTNLRFSLTTDQMSTKDCMTILWTAICQQRNNYRNWIGVVLIVASVDLLHGILWHSCEKGLKHLKFDPTTSTTPYLSLWDFVHWIRSGRRIHALRSDGYLIIEGHKADGWNVRLHVNLHFASRRGATVQKLLERTSRCINVKQRFMAWVRKTDKLH